ncbi:hypothetical protein PB2503_09834 [Parvularcula bermudensis HTCC2503]|uniref:Uncharacterized protein n=2 Tax=Parvularcula TaxID=208215 RepID=E0TED3_PARBH|nr:hypothetical protein PB2503_09834 [Parvularcula bermudensis HTCC2503]
MVTAAFSAGALAAVRQWKQYQRRRRPSVGDHPQEILDLERDSGTGVWQVPSDDRMDPSRL